MNHCLKFPDEATAIKMMPQYRMPDFEAKQDIWIPASHEHAIDPIGTLHKPSGEKIMVESAQVDAMEPSDGWHCNLWLKDDLPDELKQYEIYPQMPKRVWA